MISSVIRSGLRSRVIAQVPRRAPAMMTSSIMSVRKYSDHKEETFEEFTARYV